MPKKKGKFSFCGGNLALDYVNTVDWRLSDAPTDRLQDYEDLALWFHEAKLLSADELSAQKKASRRSPAKAKRAFRTAVALREVIYRLCEALLRNKRPAKKDLELFNTYVSKHIGGASVGWTPKGYTWKNQRAFSGLSALLEPVVRSAALLFTSDMAKDISQCQDDRGCGWVFLDRSRAKKRRWCSMSSCGNRAKVRRHYHRSPSS